MVRLTKKNRQRILEQNEGFSARSSFDSKNNTLMKESIELLIVNY